MVMKYRISIKPLTKPVVVVAVSAATPVAAIARAVQSAKIDATPIERIVCEAVL